MMNHATIYAFDSPILTQHHMIGDFKYLRKEERLMYNSAYSFGGFGNSCTGTGLAGVLAYIAFVLTILCTIGEKWEYFTDIIEGRGKRKKHKQKKQKKKLFENYSS